MYDLRPHRSVPYAYIPYPYLPAIGAVVAIACQKLTAWQAYGAWVILDEACLLGNLAMAYATLRKRGPATFPLVAFFWLAFFPYYVDVFMGQMNFVMTTFLHAFLCAAIARRRVALGLAFTAGLLAKMLPIVAVPALLRFRRFGTLALAAALLLATILPVAAFRQLVDVPAPKPLSLLGIEKLRVPSGIHQVLSHLSPKAAPEDYAGSPSFGSLLQHFVRIPWLSGAIRLAFLGSAIAITFLAAESLPLSAALIVSSYFLTYAHPWEHHYVIALPLLSVLCYRQGRWPRRAILAWLPLALPTPYILYGTRTIESALYPLSKALGAVILFTLFVAVNLSGDRRWDA
ncbi:MAG: hypothetical protein U0166_12190 [Acidobacteriota bacterium]